MNRWSPQWLSLGGKKTLILSVLQDIPIYWFSLFRVPTCVMVCLWRLFFKFIWSGKGEFSITHLADWESLSLPSYWGGWGFKNLKFFNISLYAKSLWRGVSRTGLWGDIICSKYMKRLSFTSWLWPGSFWVNSPSSIWSSLLTTLPVILRHLRWLASCGNNIYIGHDPIVGIDHWQFSQDMLHILHDKNIVFLCQAYDNASSITPKWSSPLELGLDDQHVNEWNYFLTELIMSSIMLNDDLDIIIWTRNKQAGIVKANIVYESILQY